jgi:hypothetical protein
VEDAGLDRDAVVLALRQVLDARRLVAPASDEALALTVAHAMLRELADTTQRELACAELETAARDPRLDRAVPPLLRETVAPILQRSCGADIGGDDAAPDASTTIHEQVAYIDGLAIAPARAIATADL